MRYIVEMKFLNDNQLCQLEVEASSKQEAERLALEEAHPAPCIILEAGPA